MRELLEAGAQVDLPNVMGVTPLMATTGVGVRNINFGANRSPDFEGDAEIENKVIASLEILLAAGADINARVADTQSRTARIARPTQITDRDGQTALYAAAGRGWARVASFLVEHGAEVDIVDARGRSPLDEATSLVNGQPIPGSDKVVEVLRAASATAF
jgi:ankyrin repeat protein